MRDDIEHAIDRPEDALDDTELGNRLGRQTMALQEAAQRAFWHLAVLRDDPTLDLDADQRRHLEQGYVEVRELVHDIEDADDYSDHLRWRLSDARKGEPDPSTLTREERRAWRASRLRAYVEEHMQWMREHRPD